MALPFPDLAYTLLRCCIRPISPFAASESSLVAGMLQTSSGQSRCNSISNVLTFQFKSYLTLLLTFPFLLPPPQMVSHPLSLLTLTDPSLRTHSILSPSANPPPSKPI